MSSATTATPALVASSTATSSLDNLRRASWLKCNYSDPVWIVTDTDDDSRPIRINFHYRLADGRCLTETDQLYPTVKEFAWFVRDGRFSKIDTAYAHQAAVYQQLAIAHALSLRGISSYAHLQRGDVEALVQEFRFGLDGVLHASERVAEHIARIENHPEARSSAYRRFPVFETGRGRSGNAMDTSQLIADCNLPKSALYLPRVNWVLATAAVRNGMVPRSTKQVAETIPPPQNVTKQQLQRSLQALDTLYAIRHHAACELPSFRPFPDGVMKTANQYGVDPQPTPVPPPKLVLHLLEQSARWVATHSSPILTCIDELRAAQAEPGKDVESAIARCRASLPDEIDRKLMDRGHDRFLLSAVEMLVTASWLIIAAFGARRYEETIDLYPESLRGDDEDGWWLNCFISKTTRERELIPVPLIVARAVQTLISLSAPARAAGYQDVFWWVAPSTVDRWGAREIKPRALLNTFADFVETPSHDDGQSTSRWHWVPRQFRRFFAVLYFYRHEGADIATLSYFLRHFDIETTRGYVTRDPEAAKIWRDVEREYVRRLADSIVSGEREVGGAMGDRLKKLAKLIKDRLEKRLFVSKETIGGTLHQIMERGGLVITPKAWVTCTCPRTNNAAKKARCRTGQAITEEIVGPSYADAGPTVCRECRWALMEPSKDSYACRTRAQIEASIGSVSGEGTLFRELERAHLVDLRQYEGPAPAPTPAASPGISHEQ